MRITDFGQKKTPLHYQLSIFLIFVIHIFHQCTPNVKMCCNCSCVLCLQVKLDSPTASVGKPSRVLHFRGVPSDATEGEIVQLGLPFGRMTNLVLAKKKNQVG